MTSDSTAATPTPTGVGLTHLDSVNRAVFGFVVGAVLTFLTTVAMVYLDDLVVRDFGWHSAAGWVELVLKILVLLVAIVATYVMLRRLVDAKIGMRPSEERKPLAGGDNVDHRLFQFPNFMRGLPGIGKPVVVYGWFLVLMAVISAIYSGIPKEIYESFLVLIEMLTTIFGLDIIGDPILDRIDAVGSDIAFLVYVPATYLYCYSERKRIAQRD